MYNYFPQSQILKLDNILDYGKRYKQGTIISTFNSISSMNNE